MTEQQMPARIWASSSWTFSSDPRPPYNTPFIRADIAERMAEALEECLDLLDGSAARDRGESALSAFKDSAQDRGAS